MTEVSEFAWCAGFIDGEGSCGFYPYVQRGHTYGRIILSASQIHTEVLFRVQATLGGTVRGPYKYRKQDSPLWHWRIQNLNDVEVAFGLIEPWLSSPKTKQISEAISEMKEWKNRGA